MIFTTEHIHRKLHGSPCIPVLCSIISCILFETESPFFLIPAITVMACLILVKAWRLVLLCLLLCLCSWGTVKRCLRHDNITATRYGRPEETLIETSGSVIRSFSHSVWLKCDSPSALMELIIPEGVAMRMGERWAIRGTTSEIPPTKTPGAFDRKQWLARHHIVSRLHPIELQFLGKGNIWSRVLASSESWREKIKSVLKKGSKEGDSRTGVMVSLLLGDKQAMEANTLRIFREGGCLHIFAVSGLHVGFAAGIFFFIFSIFRLSPIAVRLFTLLPLAAYVFVTGMPVSAMRAFVMIFCFFLGIPCAVKFTRSTF